MDKVKRECGTCTKCCEGYLTGEALGHTFFLGKPCHFVAIGKGCTVYAKRPKEPCVTYKCGWLTNEDIPEWMKPDAVNIIIDIRNIEGHSYLNLREAGSNLSASVLNWFIQYVLKNQLNAVWQVNGGENWMGSATFVKIIESHQKEQIKPKM
jgi:hypothetical protein